VDYEGGVEEGEEEGGKSVWFPPGLLAMYMHDGSEKEMKKKKKKEEGGMEEGEEGEEVPTHPREVDLKRVVEALQTRT
jgi:hypothetical protein